MNGQERILKLLARWAAHSEQYWYSIPGGPPGQGCYGTGYNAWGVQTNQKYLSAMAVLGTLGPLSGAGAAGWAQHSEGELLSLARERALAALRFSLDSHVSGPGRCTDGTQWGHTWISGLGIERMMHGVYLLDPYLVEPDRAALRRVLISEADWLLAAYHRGAVHGVVADRWNASGRNAPESNLWNGALLWRTAVSYPDHPHAAEWEERAHCFLINAISVPADAADERVVAGKPVRARHVGANFFPHYALDHHGYLNVGYMVICLSNAAMLHFDLRAQGLPAPESLYHHLEDLWHVVRRLVFGNGRLARIGGDSRVRYTYCQEYLLPALVLAADRFAGSGPGDGMWQIGRLFEGQLSWIEQEAAYNEQGPAQHQGSFYGRRLAPLAEQSPYYYTRLESDRANTLGMALAYLRCLPDEGVALEFPTGETADDSLLLAWMDEGWCEPEHGAVLHRSRSRFVSFAWRAHGLAQGMCQPPDDGHLAEWSNNLCGVVRFLGDDGLIEGGQTTHRRLQGYHLDDFEGGFATCGAIVEGVDVRLPEGWQGARSALHQIAFIALPDGHTAVGLQHCRTEDHRTYLAAAKGLQLNLPNDLFNGFRRRLVTEGGELILDAPTQAEEVTALEGRWVQVEGWVGVVSLYGAEPLAVCRSSARRGGKYGSLYVEEICLGCRIGTRAVDPETTVLDVGWAVLSGSGLDQTQAVSQHSTAIDLPGLVRGVRVRSLDGVWYAIAANFGASQETWPAAWLLGGTGRMRGEHTSGHDLASGERLDRGAELSLPAGQVRVWALEVLDG